MKISLTECPRDAMQGVRQFIPTDLKIKYLNSLLKVGFDTLDFGSFVSPKAIPQMKDTAELISELSLTNTKLLSIIANERGAEDATKFNQVDVVGFPFSVSEQFQQRNTNSSREQSLERVKNIISISENTHVRVYLSMAFGNPYNEEWSPEIILRWADALQNIGITEIVLSDTVGVATPSTITSIYHRLNAEITEMNINCHFHSTPDTWKEKIEAAQEQGCTGFDSALKGYGGCPMANDELVGNIATENLIQHFTTESLPGINEDAFSNSMKIADEIFGNYF
ncbi:MAG: hydroxymethylglutaryl-CoA lyase [Saprospiraceae bacterium]|jgi:hydroxymethylglutaryl-CoA lyase